MAVIVTTIADLAQQKSDAGGFGQRSL